MAYSQIAQKDIQRAREDGTPVTFRITFEQDGVAAAALDIPVVEDIIVTHGDRQDKVDKGIKVSKLELTFEDVPAATDLIYRIESAKFRELRVTVENLTNPYTEFVGYVVPDTADFQLYEDVQRVSVLATGHLNFIEDTTAVNATRTIRQMGEDINTALSLPRNIDVYTSLRHTGQLITDPIPNWIQGNQKVMAGNTDDGTLLAAASGMCAALGWQVFQRNGKLVMSDVYDRAFNPTTVNKYEDDGAGNYTQTTENVVRSLNDTNVIRGGSFQRTPPIARRTQQYNFVTRDPLPAISEGGDVAVYGNTNTFANASGLVRGGDTLSIRIWGTVYSVDPANDVSAEIEFATVTLKSVIGDPDIEVFNVTQTIVFIAGGSTSQQWGTSGTPVVVEVPEGFLGTVEVKHNFSGGTFTVGSGADLDRSEADSLSITFDPISGEDNELFHFFDAASADPLGDVFTRSFFVADIDQYTDRQAFGYSTGGVFAGTFEWIDAGGNARLSVIVARRLADVMVGSGLKFSVQVRATTRCDLMTVFQIVDNHGVTHTCLPLEIKHNVLRGYYSIRLREVNDQRNAAADANSYGFTARGDTGAGSGSSGGGGGSSAIWGAITGDIDAQTDLKGKLDEKANLAGGNTFTGQQNFNDGAEVQDFLRIPSGVDKF